MTAAIAIDNAAASKTGRKKMAKKAKKQKEKQFKDPNERVVFDRAADKQVTVRSDGKGEPSQLQRMVDDLVEFCEPGDFPFPTAKIVVVIDGREQRADRRRDNIDLLLQGGYIGQEEYIVARELRTAYDVANDQRIGSVDLNGNRGGGSDQYEIAKWRLRARDKANELLALTGDADSQQQTVDRRRAVFSVICRRMSFDEMIMHFGHPAEYWRARLCKGLEVMAQAVTTGRYKKPTAHACATAGHCQRKPLDVV